MCVCVCVCVCVNGTWDILNSLADATEEQTDPPSRQLIHYHNLSGVTFPDYRLCVFMCVCMCACVHVCVCVCVCVMVCVCVCVANVPCPTVGPMLEDVLSLIELAGGVVSLTHATGIQRGPGAQHLVTAHRLQEENSSLNMVLDWASQSDMKRAGRLRITRLGFPCPRFNSNHLNSIHFNNLKGHCSGNFVYTVTK